MVFILITPSQPVRIGLGKAVDSSVRRNTRLDAFELHQIILATLHDNWRMYIRSLERILVAQVSQAIPPSNQHAHHRPVGSSHTVEGTKRE